MAGPIRLSSGPLQPSSGPIMPGNGPLDPATSGAQLSSLVNSILQKPAVQAAPVPVPTGKAPDQNSPDPISWVFDMLDRPARAIRDSVSATWDNVVDGGKMWSDLAQGKTQNVGKDAGNILGDAGEAVSAPFRGLFSTNASDQQTSSQLIEKGVDKYGKTFDPHYKDTANNVNPILKGVLGFAGDVATDPLTYVGGPAIHAALLEGKALLAGGKAAIDTLKPSGGAKAVAKMADQAIGGDAKAADTLDTLTKGAAADAVPAPAAAPVVTKITEELAPKTPEVSQPTTPEGVASVLTGTDQPITHTPRPDWTPEQDDQLSRAMKRLDKMPPGAAADKLQEQVDAWTAQREAAQADFSSLPKADTPAPEAGTPAADAPAAPAGSPPVDKPVDVPISKSLTEQFQGSKDFPNFKAGLELIGQTMKKEKLTARLAFQKLDQDHLLDNLFGEEFRKGLQKYGTTPAAQKRFAEMLDHVNRVAVKGGHLDEPGFGTKLAQAHTALRNAFKDLAPAADTSVVFKARSTVKDSGVNLESTLAHMKAPATNATGLTQGIEDEDLRTLAKDSLDRLREDKPGMTRTTATGAKSTGGDTTKSYAEHRARLGTFNQVKDTIQATELADKRIGEVKQLGGAAFSRARLEMVLGIHKAGLEKTGLVEGLTQFRDGLGSSHWVDDRSGRALNASADQVWNTLASTPTGQRIMEKALFNPDTPVSKSQLLEAIVGAGYGDSREQILATLKGTDKWYRDGEVPNFLSKGEQLGKVDHQLTGTAQGVKLLPGEIAKKNIDEATKQLKGYHVYQSADSLANDIADLIASHADDFKGLSRVQAEGSAVRLASEVRDITEAGQQLIDQARNDPAYIADAVQMIAHPERVTAAVGEQSGALADSVEISGAALKASIPEPDLVVAQQTVKGVEAAQRGDVAAEKAAAAKASDAAAKAVDEAYAEMRLEGALSGAVKDSGVEGLPPEATVADAITGQEVPARETTFADKGYHSKQVGEWVKMVQDEEAGYPRMQSRGMSKLQAASGAFNKAANMVRNGFSFEALHTEMATQLATFMNKYANLTYELQKLDKPISEGMTVARQVWEDARHGIESAPEYADARKLTDQIISHWMNAGDKTGKHTMLGEPFLGRGGSLKPLVKHLQASGIIPEDFKLTDATEELLRGDSAHFGSIAGSLANLLEESGVRYPDIYDFYTKMAGAVTTYGTHAGLAEDLRATGLKLGYLSEKPLPGMGRIKVTNDSIFANFLTGEGAKPLYGDPEVAGAIMRMSDLLVPKSKSSGELAHMLQVFDDAQQLWKWGEVAVRPGTRIHNYISDNLMTWMAMGHQGYRSSYAKAVKIMLANRAGGDLTQDEMIQALQRIGGNVKDKTYSGGEETLFSGQHGSFTGHETWRLFNKSGLVTSAKAIERPDKENLSGVGRFGSKVYNSPVGKWANKLTEATENQVRLTHYGMGLQRALETGYVTTRWGKKVSVLGKDGMVDEELLTHALGDSVRRYHPDPHMLTQFEKNTVRRVLPFYSWNRSAIPAILDAMYMHPGRGLAFNKASFAVGQSLGVQGNNLADPFPNGMWPGFLTGQAQGPQFNIGGQLFMANPGIPTWDVANMFTDPNNISGSVSPLLAVPATLATGKDFRTGQPITNKYDAFDQQLPIVANYEAASGNSVLGSLVGALTGNGPQKTSAGAQQQIEPNAGGLGWLNWGLGAQVSHVNKDSYVQAGIAQQQKRLSDILAGKSPQLGVGG